MTFRCDFFLHCGAATSSAFGLLTSEKASQCHQQVHGQKDQKTFSKSLFSMNFISRTIQSALRARRHTVSPLPERLPQLQL